MEINRSQAEKVLELVDAGLVSGLGNREPGQMCIQAAVCYAFDLPHGDRPTCVGDAVRSFGIRLNDANWPSDKDRAEGMRKFSIAQLGSNSIDQNAFGLLVVKGIQRKMVPIALRAAGKVNPKFADELEVAAKKCETVADDGLRAAVEEAREVALRARKAAADAAAYAAADAAAYAADAAAAAADADAYAADADAARKEVLTAAAQIGVDALIELKSPGCEFLSLCD